MLEQTLIIIWCKQVPVLYDHMQKTYNHFITDSEPSFTNMQKANAGWFPSN